MKLIIAFIDVILYTSLFTACCATGLCMATERLIDLHQPQLASSLHILVFGSTLLVYNTPRLLTKRYDTIETVQKFRAWHFFFFFTGMLLSLAGLYYSSPEILITSILLSVFAFAYFLPVLPFKNKKRLRDFGWLKIFVLAGVWTTATSVLPIVYLQKNITDYPFEIILRLTFIFTLCVIFDIRDMQADLDHNIYTLPHKIGLKNSYRLINTALLLFVYLSVMQYFHYPVIERLVGALLTAIATKSVAEYLKKHPSERAYMGLADGVMLVYALFILAPGH